MLCFLSVFFLKIIKGKGMKRKGQNIRNTKPHFTVMWAARAHCGRKRYGVKDVQA